VKDILARSNIEVLQQFTWSNVLLAFDFDGTLAPIVDNPDSANIRARTRELLAQVAARYPCVIISGRAQADVLRRVRRLNIVEVIGNHGLEPWQYSEPFSEQVQKWLVHIKPALEHVSGVFIEDKIFSLALHYRHARDKKKARAAILEEVESLSKVRIIGGKDVINILPKGAPHKGIALQNARTRLKCDTALYVGDDETDEDVFMLDEPGRLLTIRVGEKTNSSADFFIPGQHEIDELLTLLISFRPNNEMPRRRAR
jgi:trehalose 6-phosphate phosphatase